MKKILVVDDYVPTRNLVVEALSQAGNYEISEASNGIEALGLFQAHKYDMVLSDIMMPGMGGMELLSSIRDINPATAVIMITAHPALELTVSAIKNGAVDFLKKPFDIDDLLFKVNLYLREDNSSQGASGEGEGYLKFKREDLSLKGYIYESIENATGANEEIFQKIVELALKIVSGECCALFLYDVDSGDFYPRIIRDNNNGSFRQNTIPVLKDLFKEVVEKKDALIVNSESDALIAPSVICAPLMIRDNVLGVLSIRKKKNMGVFTKNDLHHILSLAKRASLNLENKVLYESMYNNLLDTFKALVASIQMRDYYTEEHSQRVCELAMKIARGLNCSTQEIESLKIAALLHDIGKIAIPDNILLKTESLSEEEYQIIKNHPQVGEEILSPVMLLEKERDIIRYHHERWDGKGYPCGLAATKIPLLARILAVADAFDAMTSTRPYRKAMGHEMALAELRKNVNLQFDAQIVDVFSTII